MGIRRIMVTINLTFPWQAPPFTGTPQSFARVNLAQNLIQTQIQIPNQSNALQITTSYLSSPFVQNLYTNLGYILQIWFNPAANQPNNISQVDAQNLSNEAVLLLESIMNLDSQNMVQFSANYQKISGIFSGTGNLPTSIPANLTPFLSDGIAQVDPDYIVDLIIVFGVLIGLLPSQIYLIQKKILLASTSNDPVNSILNLLNIPYQLMSSLYKQLSQQNIGKNIQTLNQILNNLNSSLNLNLSSDQIGSIQFIGQELIIIAQNTWTKYQKYSFGIEVWKIYLSCVGISDVYSARLAQIANNIGFSQQDKYQMYLSLAQTGNAFNPKTVMNILNSSGLNLNSANTAAMQNNVTIIQNYIQSIASIIPSNRVYSRESAVLNPNQDPSQLSQIDCIAFAIPSHVSKLILYSLAQQTAQAQAQSFQYQAQRLFAQPLIWTICGACLLIGVITAFVLK